MICRYDLSREALADLLTQEPRYRVDQVWEGLYSQALHPEEITTLPAQLRTRLTEILPPALTLVTERTDDRGDTVKWLWSLADGALVETVLLCYPQRATVCVSTQAGCAMACAFCATGQQGFQRHLTSGEIVEQVVRAIRHLRPRRVSNVVFMGMGEPLANYDATWTAVERLHDAVGIGARHLTVSTVGIVPGILRMAGEALPVSLAVSLHAAHDALRDRLVPLNRRYPLAELVDACGLYRTRTGRRISLEWALMDGINDSDTEAARLAGIALELRAHVNLIPLNPTPGFGTRGTPPDGVRRFRGVLQERGVNVTVRRNRGATIGAACGQLRAEV